MYSTPAFEYCNPYSLNSAAVHQRNPCVRKADEAYSKSVTSLNLIAAQASSESHETECIALEITEQRGKEANENG
jgi:hypothetical protein